MFVETECPESGVLLAWRRARGPEDAPIWAAHVLTGATGAIEYATDRSLFLGRTKVRFGSRGAAAQAVEFRGRRARSDLSVCVAARRWICQRIELTFVTLAAASREALLTLIAKYQRPDSVARAFLLARTRAQLELRYLGIEPASAHRLQELASHRLFYPDAQMMRPQGKPIDA